MRLFFLIIALFFNFFLFGQSNSDKWNLNKCIKYALENNISIKRGDVQAKIEKLRLKQSKLSYYPSINFSSSAGNQFGKSVNPLTYSFTNTQLLIQKYDLSGFVNLYNFGSIRNTVKSQDNIAKSKLLIADKAKVDVILSVVAYYFQILYAQDEININKLQLEHTRKQFEVTKSHVDAGTLPELNLLQSEAQLFADSINLLNSNATYINNILTMKSLLAINDESEFNIEPPVESDISKKLTQSAETVYQSALKNQPEQKSYIFRIKAAQFNIKAIKAAMLPVFSMNYDINSVFSNYIKSTPFSKWWNNYHTQLDKNFNQQVFIKVSVPIFNNGRLRFNYQQAKLNLDDLQYEQLQESIKLRQDIFSVFSDVSVASNKFDVAKNMVDKLQSAYNITYSGYEAGGTKLLDLITSQNELYKANLQLLNAKYDYAFKIKILDILENPYEILNQ